MLSTSLYWTSCKYILGKWHIPSDKFSIICLITSKVYPFKVMVPWESWNPVLKAMHYFSKWLNQETTPAATYFNRDIFMKKCQPQICLGRCTLCYFLSFYFSWLASGAAWRMGSFRFPSREGDIESVYFCFKFFLYKSVMLPF